MSGIFGLLALDEAPVDGPVLDRQIVHAESGCVITADARIDYRNDGDKRSDAEAILGAYLERGEACLDSLLGDFAFAIWDPREQQLFCARDHFGMRPLYYHHAPGKRFVFASDARVIFRDPDVPYTIDHGRVADFLVPQLEWIDYTSTFYEGVYRLPPGHMLTVSAHGIRITEFWSPSPGPALPKMSDREYQDGLINVLSKAVNERLRLGRENVGTMLSGGVDSGSVAAIANDLLMTAGGQPIRSFSAARACGEPCDESQRIYASIRHLGTDAAVIRPEDIEDVDELLFADIAEPFDGSFLFMKALFHAARDQGLDGLLDGGGGDIVLNEGNQIRRWLRSGQVVRAVRELRASSVFHQETPSRAKFVQHGFQAAAPEFLKRIVRPYRRRAKGRQFLTESLISHELADHVNIGERIERMWATFPGDPVSDPALERVRKIRPNVSAGRERYSRLAASFELDARDPFLDLNVVNFCTQLPGEILLRNGWPKFILREALADKLPDVVRWGRGKPHIGWHFNELLINRERRRGNLCLNGLESALEGYVDPDRLLRAWQDFEAGQDAEQIYAAHILSLWLQQSAKRPVVKDQRFR